ncbi:caspase family protein [Amycolatopsis vancoresmycina]|uniref:caspase family protein n=1 Tax=Amycolatopsis vancoresmycina TaxID=208444 RepID=UPI000524262D|nr:caspase family protein [Amycolatopsis vancoresmycina]
MRRAAVLIGVRESGDLPPLSAVLPGIRDVGNWARGQGFETVRTLTDEHGKLGVRAIQDTIAELVEPGVVDQLVVYFAGHGVNIGRTEYWLLSDAPAYTNEAVNVAGSVELARWCGVPHVVFVSDACRTAADGITQQTLRGSDVFPNAGGAAGSRPVDLFYACALGSPAYEVKDPGYAAARYDAVYTKALVDALTGRAQEVLEPADGEPPSSLVRPWPLRTYLEGEVGRRLAMLVPSGDLIQQPDAIITSPPSAWLSRLDGVSRPAGTRGPAVVEPPPTLGSVTRLAIDEAVRGAQPAPIFSEAADQGITGAAELSETMQLRDRLSGRGPSLSDSGFVVRGGEFAFAWNPATPVSQDGNRVLLGYNSRGTSVFLQFGNGTAVMLPVLIGQVGVITIQDGTVVDIDYGIQIPGERHWDRYRPLRALVAATARQGLFRLERDNVDAFAIRLREDRMYDPTVVLHAAYAYHELQRDDLLRELFEYVGSTVDAALFDVALLAGALRPQRIPILPVVPILARGWALLDALGARLPREVTDLRRHLVPGLWTQFTADGAGQARAAVESTGGRL